VSPHRAVRDPPKDDSEGRGDVADRVEGSVVTDDFENVGGLRSAEPATGIDGDTKIAPVLHAEDGSTVNQVGTGVRQESCRFGADDSPVADRHDLGVIGLVRQTEVSEH